MFFNVYYNAKKHGNFIDFLVFTGVSETWWVHGTEEMAGFQVSHVYHKPRVTTISGNLLHPPCF